MEGLTKKDLNYLANKIASLNTKVIKEMKLKSTGEVIPVGTKAVVEEFVDAGVGMVVSFDGISGSKKFRVSSAYKNFSGFTKPPSERVMESWIDEGVAKTVTGKRTEPDGYGSDDSPSWLLALGII